MATGTKSKVKGRKGRLGKNKSRIAVYYNSSRYQFNKARRIARHLKRYPGDDKSAREALKFLIAQMPLGMSREFSAKYC